MNREAIKTVILIVLVGTSLLLSYLLWSYQPSYEELYNPDYVPEVNIGGKENTKADVIAPNDIIFKKEEQFFGFKRPVERELFFKEFSSWVLYDVRIGEAEGKVVEDEYVELVFPGAVPAEALSSLLTFHESVDMPTWSFDRIFITVNEDAQVAHITVLSADHRFQLTAIIEKKDAYRTIVSHLHDQMLLQEYVTLQTNRSLIYLPKEEVDIAEKTLVLALTKPELFFNILFPNPSIVTPNPKDAYFTDGQRGLRILNDNRMMEFVFPIHVTDDELTPYELLDISINHINEHNGWTNDYMFAGINQALNKVQYDLYYDGYPILSNNNSTVLEQQWKGNDLHQYIRPLTQISNTLSSSQVTLPSGEEVIQYLEENEDVDINGIRDIKIGYVQRFLNDEHSVVLNPGWYMLYNDEWRKVTVTPSQDEEDDLSRKDGR